MPAVLLAGAFGQRNPGDDALLDAFTRGLPDWDVVATVGPQSLPAEDAGRVVPSAEPRRVARMAASADAVVFAGGTVFKGLRQETGRPPLDLLRRALALAYGTKALGKPLALVGVGASPIASRQGRVLMRRLVAQADLLVLRDEESADVLVDAGAPAPFRIGADPAWTLFDAPPRLPELRSGPVLVALSHEAGGGRLADDLAAALVPVLTAQHPVALQPWQIGGTVRPDDLDLARAVNERLGGAAELLLPPVDLHEAQTLFARMRLVVGLRFHALVAAAAAGTSFIAVAHEPKLAAVARRLGQPVVGAEGKGLDPRELSAAILQALQSGTQPRAAAVRGEIARSEQSMRLLRLLLSRGRAEEADTIGTLPLAPGAWSS
ncbi:MAG TPA: polysaccharide pyruvyl transferase family protein [Solirubrobacteraceae bacterium]|jgi:polysaccharide pyruvyl transferase WcaK-like protein|nr:polysaccharide pyruvyl transferase family protein [Solirubrobacteraceae bacterium]